LLCKNGWGAGQQRPRTFSLWSAVVWSIWKGAAAAVDLRAQSSDEREGKRQGEVVGVRCVSGYPRGTNAWRERTVHGRG